MKVSDFTTVYFRRGEIMAIRTKAGSLLVTVIEQI